MATPSVAGMVFSGSSEDYRKKLALMLASNALSTAPVQHPAEGWNRMAQALLLGLDERKERQDNADTARAVAGQVRANIGGGSPSSSVGPTGPSISAAPASVPQVAAQPPAVAPYAAAYNNQLPQEPSVGMAPVTASDPIASPAAYAKVLEQMGGQEPGAMALSTPAADPVQPGPAALAKALASPPVGTLQQNGHPGDAWANIPTADNAPAVFSGGPIPAGYDSPAPTAQSAPALAAGRPLLDLIGQAEGTDKGRGYNETLAYGKFTGGPVELTNMTLDQVDQLQRRMLAHPGNGFNSSALGRYQIVGKTLRGLRQEMGLSGTEKFTPELQDQMALRLAARRGENPAALRNEWEGLRRVSADQIVAAARGQGAAASAPIGTPDAWAGAPTDAMAYAPSGMSPAPVQMAALGTGTLSDAGPDVAPTASPENMRLAQALAPGMSFMPQTDASMATPQGRPAVPPVTGPVLPPRTGALDPQGATPYTYEPGRIPPQKGQEILRLLESSSPARQRAGYQMYQDELKRAAEFDTQTRPDGSVWRVPKHAGYGAPQQVFGPQMAPKNPLEEEGMRLANESKRRELEGEGAIPLTPAERAAYGIPAGQAVYKNRKGELKSIQGGTVVNIDQKGETKFSEESSKIQAKRFGELSEAGANSRQSISDLRTLQSLMTNIQTGKLAEAKATIGPYAEALGIKVDGLSEIQAAEAIINRVAPSLRTPGVGAMSDFESRKFIQSMPQIGSTPEGNEIINRTMTAMHETRVRAAEIAERAMNREITPAEANKEIRNLPDPMEEWRAHMTARGQQQPAPQQRGTGGAPQQGGTFQTPQGPVIIRRVY